MIYKEKKNKAIIPVAETVQHGSERCRLFTDLAD